VQQSGSPNYHKWLTPEEFGQQFGASDADIQAVTSWLQGHGFQVQPVSKGHSLIEFSGNAGQVKQAFHTEIHKFIVNGQEHWANATDQQIPAALSAAVAGVSTLHNFLAVPQVSVANTKVPFTVSAQSPVPQFDASGGGNYLAPGDYATIYNAKPLYPTITGAGVTIAVVGRTNILLSDIASFRSLFGLPANNPIIIVNGTNPGIVSTSEETEAVLDTSWAGALATGATVDLVVSASTNTTDGADLSEVYIVDNNIANVMTESFASCEASMSSAQASAISSLAQQAAAQGISYTVSAGDAGSAGCDNFNTETSATGPVSVNGLASTPYNLAVGGTQFNENGNTSAYWSSSNSSSYASALSYIPEDVWNANCTGAVCGTGSILAGGGGASVFFSKPSWQSGVPGIPNDGARDLPDVALTAAGHDAYLVCLGGSCSSSSPGFYAVYGTSASSPSFASIIALINQKAGGRQGQLAPKLYSLAASESLASCNASNTSVLPAQTCYFNDVTIGTNAVPGEANYNTSSETYPATVGFDLASGLGSVNIASLVNGWSGSPIASVSPTSLTFASQTVGTSSASKSVTLSNNGSGALAIQSITTTGANASDFTTTNTCGSSLAAGSSCSISVTFDPGATGTRNANLVVTDNSNNVAGSTQTVSLTGTGTSSSGPTPTVLTTYVGTYGSATPTYTGSTVTLPLRAYDPSGAAAVGNLTAAINTSNGSFSIVLEQISGAYSVHLTDPSGNSAPYPYVSLTPNGATAATSISISGLQLSSTSLALAGDELQFNVTLTLSGTFTDTVALGAQDATGYSVPWYATAAADWNSGAITSAPAVTLNPTSLTFANQTLSTTSAAQSVTVTNSGTATLTGLSVSVTGTNSGDYNISANTCGTSLAVGTNCSVSVTFTPQATGTRSASLSFADNASNSPQSAPLTGTGTTSTGPAPTVLTTYVGTYGSATPTYNGSSVTLPLRAYDPSGAAAVGNLTASINTASGSYGVVLEQISGAYTVHLTDPSGKSAPYPYVSLTANGATTTTSISISGLQLTATSLALAGNELQFNVTLTFSGAFNNTISLGAQDPNGYSVPWFETVAANWTSGAAAPSVTLNPTALTFASQTLATTSAAQTVTITNTGSATLTGLSVALGGTNSADYSISANTCGTSLAIAANCSVSVTFTPQATGTRSASLQVTDNAANSPQSVSLTGTGATSTGPTPTVLTTYVGTYGSATPTYTGNTVTLPLRAYDPSGAGAVGNLTANINTSAGAYSLVLEQISGAYSLHMYSPSGASAPWPYVALSPNGQTTAISISLAGLQITAASLTLAGNELQFNVTVTFSGTFSDTITLGAQDSTSYSAPWYGTVAADWIS